MKINNKTLFLVLAGLIAVVVILRFTGSKRNAKTLNTEIVQIDTSRITFISIYRSSDHGEEILLSRSGNNWTASNAGTAGEADALAITNALSEIISLRAERLVAKSPEKWADYQVADTLGTRVVIKEGRKTTLDLVIGRFDYQPPPQGYNQYQDFRQNQLTGISYVRNSGEDEVYAVNGFLGLSFNREFNSWRNQTILNMNSALINKVVFDYPADSGYIAQKSPGGWMVAGLTADSLELISYFNRISRQRSAEFTSGLPSLVDPDYQVLFEGDNMSPVQVNAYIQPDGKLVLNSSDNPNSWFSSTTDGVFAEIFVPVNRFTVEP